MFKERVNKLVGDEYEVTGEYIRSNKKVEIRHNTCGRVYEVTPNHFTYDGRRCRYCGYQDKIKPPEVYEKQFYELANGEYELLSTYRRKEEKVRVLHKTCGHEYCVVANSFLQGTRCPECFGNKRKTTEEFRKEVEEKSDGTIELKSEYVNNRVKVAFYHKECGNTYKATPKDFLRGNRCPFCKQSKGERMVRGILESFNASFEIEKSYEDLKVNHQYLPYDFYLPEHNLLIEYDGEQHFKEVEYFGGAKKLQSQKRRDTLKNDYAERHGYNLLRIPYTDSEKQVREKIQHIISRKAEAP